MLSEFHQKYFFSNRAQKKWQCFTDMLTRGRYVCYICDGRMGPLIDFNVWNIFLIIFQMIDYEDEYLP